MPPPPADPRARLTCDQIWAQMRAVANDHGAICRTLEMQEDALEPGDPAKGIAPRAYRTPYLEIKPETAPAGRPVVLIVGGLHPSELLPPPSLVEFASRLVRAYADRRRAGIEYRLVVDGSVPYARWTVSDEHVRAMVDAATILIVPAANPAGRDYVLHPQGGVLRGNRNVADCPGWGVNLNRNFNIAWPTTYYHPADARQLESYAAGVCTAERPSDYRGRAPASEPETRNLQRLIDDRDVRWFVDVHMKGRWILRPWAMAGQQHDDPHKSFLSSDLDRTRRVTDRTYEEYLPDATPHRVAQTHDTVAHAMHHAIRNQAGTNARAKECSTYTVLEACRVYAPDTGNQVAPQPGTALDYAVARGLRPGEPPAYGFAMEVGKGDEIDVGPENDGGFMPPPGKYDKVEREMHAGLYTVLRAAAGLLGKKAKKGK